MSSKISGGWDKIAIKRFTALGLTGLKSTSIIKVYLFSVFDTSS